MATPSMANEPTFSIKLANKAYHTYDNAPQKHISVNILYFIITQNFSDHLRSQNEELICLHFLNEGWSSLFNKALQLEIITTEVKIKIALAVQNNVVALRKLNPLPKGEFLRLRNLLRGFRWPLLRWPEVAIERVRDFPFHTEKSQKVFSLKSLKECKKRVSF